MTRNHAQITGLTTAAGLWATASLGLCIGTGFYGGVLAAFLVILVTMVALPSLERKRRTRREYVCYYLELDNVKRTDDFYEQITPVPEAEVQIVPARSGLPGNVGLELTIPADWEESQQMLEDLRKTGLHPAADSSGEVLNSPIAAERRTAACRSPLSPSCPVGHCGRSIRSISYLPWSTCITAMVTSW